MSHQSGYIDDHNYLCLSGRYKEIINRGGEKISPFEAARSERRLGEYFEFVSEPNSCPTPWHGTAALFGARAVALQFDLSWWICGA